jgi:hypothetical protein
VAATDQNLGLRAAFFVWKVGGAPRVSRTSLRGVASARPTLAMTISAGRGAPRLKAISLGLSRGLSFAQATRQVLVRNVVGRRLKFSARVIRRRLQITLVHASPRIRITIRYAAIRVSQGLAADVRGRHHPAVTVSVLTLDAGNHGVGERARIRPSG